MVEVTGNLRGSYVKITVLLWADLLASYAIFVMMTYLTDVWKMKFTHASAIINIFQGAASVMPLAFSFLADTFIGHYSMLLISSVSYSIGLGFLAMSTPPVLSKATGVCTTYEPECIGDVQKILFYTSMALIAVGLAGHIVSLGTFFAQQIMAHEQDPYNQEKPSVGAFVGFFAVVLVPIISTFALAYIKPWSVRFGIPAICTLVATLIFLTGSCSYVFVKPYGSPLTRVFRVFVASMRKIHLRTPTDPNQLYYGNVDSENEVVPYTSGFRCLDKAAIISQTQSLEEQEKNKWKLCRVTEMEETKTMLRMIPMWITFILVGLVMSITNTFFLEQANHMNRKVGKLKVSLPIFLMFYEMTRSQAIKFYYALVSSLRESRRRYTAPIGIGLGMVFAVLCCITAAKVETRRIGVIEKHGLLDKPDEQIPMTIFWLLPQFLLLACLDGLVREGIAWFFRDQVPTSMLHYMILFTEAVFGAGIIGGVLSVYIVGKVSQRGGQASWFGDTLNKSRLDRYYWTLAILSSINLVIYACVAIWYAYKDSRADEEEPPEEEENTDFNEICCCCC